MLLFSAKLVLCLDMHTFHMSSGSRCHYRLFDSLHLQGVVSSSCVDVVQLCCHTVWPWLERCYSMHSMISDNIFDLQCVQMAVKRRRTLKQVTQLCFPEPHGHHTLSCTDTCKVRFLAGQVWASGLKMTACYGWTCGRQGGPCDSARLNREAPLSLQN